MNGAIVRHAYLPNVTLGFLFIESHRWATLEEGWRRDPDGPGGQRREGKLVESCVPDGSYILRPHFSAKYPQGVWALVNPTIGIYAPGTRPAGQTWGRDAVLIHSGNSVEDIEGCILIGRSHVWSGKRWEIQAGTSRPALDEMRALLGSKEVHQLYIRPTAGTSEIDQ